MQKTIFPHAVHDDRSSSFFHHSMPHIFLLPRSRSYIILLSSHAASARKELHGHWPGNANLICVNVCDTLVGNFAFSLFSHDDELCSVLDHSQIVDAFEWDIRIKGD
jgi:hypothetical protein